MPRSMQLHKEYIATSTPESEAGVLVVRRHHLLVRCSHWLNIPILLGLILSGVSIYWASPVYQHKPDPLSEFGSIRLSRERRYAFGRASVACPT